MIHNGQPLFDRVINLEGQGPEAKFSAALDVKAGDTLDSVCGWGNRNYGADTTALAVKVKSSSGKTWDAEQDFSSEQNPNGAWSYGLLMPASYSLASNRPPTRWRAESTLRRVTSPACWWACTASGPASSS